MKIEPGQTATFRQLEQARQLLEQGQFQAALDLALEALIWELSILRESVDNLEELVRREVSREAPRGQDDEPPIFAWSTPSKARLLH